jgi:hypothetical protein
MDSTRKIVKNRFRVHKPSKSQLKSQLVKPVDQSTAPGANDRAEMAFLDLSGRRAPTVLRRARGPDGKIVFSRF